jgi:hypothetical protein
MTDGSNRNFYWFMNQMKVKYQTDQNFGHKNAGTGHEPAISIAHVISMECLPQNISKNITEVFHILLG